MESVSGQGSRPRFLIADDHKIFAETLQGYLERSFTVIGMVQDGRALVSEATRLRPDLIVVDVGMPLLNGLDAALRIKKQAPKTKFVFLTMHNDPNLAAAALELGPVGFILKHSGGQELMKAIDHVLRGKPYLTGTLKPEDWIEAKARAQQFSKDMTARQRDVIQLLAEGRPLKDIAGILNVSIKTVEFHKHQIQKVFNLRSNADLVLFAVKRGLVSLPQETSSPGRPGRHGHSA